MKVKAIEAEHRASSPPRWRQPPMLALLAITLLAFGLRAYELGGLTLYGDFAYSVYAARQDLITIARERVLDGHPPLYYYLLHFWMLLLGQTELTVRIPSVLGGMLMVPLAYRLCAYRLGQTTAVLGALFVAVSPSLVHYSRQPRMYIFLALLALLSVYTLQRALSGDRRRDWLGYFVATSLLVYTHYYGLAIVMAEAAYVLWFHRGTARLLRCWAAAAGATAIIYAPWLIFAGATAATTTAGIISNAPWPQDIQGLLEQFWIPFNVGDSLGIDLARPLALIMLVLWVVAFVARHRDVQRRWREWGLLGFAFAVPIAGSLLLFAFMPYAVRPRFLIFCTPLYLLLLATILSNQRRWLTATGTLITLVVSGYALVDAYRIEPYIVEADAIRLTQHIESVATPEDAVVFQAFWQIGYFTMHYRGIPPATYSLRDLPMADAAAVLSRHPRVWLAMYRVRERDPDYPLEEWLDRNWHKAERLQMGETRLIAYVPPRQDGWRDAAVEFEAQEEAQENVPLLRLTSVQLPQASVGPNGTIAVGLRWQAVAAIPERYTFFLQLIDSQGRRWAGADREPLGGSESTAGWRAGRTVEDHMAMVLPADIPPGDYAIRVGIYPTGVVQPLIARGADGQAYKQGFSVGQARVEGRGVDELAIRHPLDWRLGSSIALLGYDLDTDFYQVGETRTMVALTDNPIQLAIPKRTYQPSDTIELTLYWQSLHPPDQDYTVFVHLEDREGHLWGQADNQPAMGGYPTSRWRAGGAVVDRHGLRIDPDTPPGDYYIKVGMYTLSTMERLPVTSAPGAADEVTLQQVTIVPGSSN